MRKLVTMLLCVVLAITQLAAQTRTIKGKVTDTKSNPVPNASVTVKGSTLGTTADANGDFSINVPGTAKVLVISSLNFTGQEVAIGNKTSIAVSLVSTAQDLQEVVVVGYGTKKKSDLTGSVATLKAADVESLPFSSVDKALQGKVAGLQSIAASGQPGASQSIVIRGISSISGSSNPLWVIDGVPVNEGNVARLQTTANLLSTLNPNDIESISVLKDAASQSIYGSRAANGVIVVTTKKGKAGKTKFRFDTEVGQSNTAYTNAKYKPLNAQQYTSITREGLVNLGRSQAVIDATINALGGNSGIDFNWLDNVSRNGTQQQYNVSAQGGNDKTTFFLSGGHFVQEGTTINSKLTRTSGNVNITNQATDKLKLGFNLNAGVVNQRAPLAGGAFGNPVLSSFFLLPTRSAYNADGSYNFSIGGLHNTIALTDLDKRFLRQAGFRGSIYGEYKILENLKFRSQYGIDYNLLEEDQYNNPLHGDGAASNGRAFSFYTRYFNWVWTNTLDLQQNITRGGDLSFSAQLGLEAQKSSGYLSSLQAQQFPPTTALTYPASGASPTTATATITEYSFASQFASAAVNYKNRYVVSGSFRRDGSSKFSPSNKFGNFYSAGATWNVDRERFMENVRFITQLKLRSSYGVNGSNTAIGNYDALPLYGYGYNYNQLPGSAPANVGDPNLTWELNKPFNVGIDVSMFKNRISFTAEYYTRTTSNLLLSVPLSRTSGFASATRNIGTMTNKGIELTLSVVPVQTRDFKWDIDFNFANNKNTVLSLPGGADIPNIPGFNYIIREGYALNSFFLREWAGVDPANGDPLWYADNTHGATTNVYPGVAARIIAGNAQPKYFGSLSNTITFKNFTISAQLYYNYGNYVYDTWSGYYLGAGFGATFNKVVRVLDRWQKPGDNAGIPKYIYGGNKNFQSGSTFFLQKGDFVRLREIQVGYDLPQNLLTKFSLSSMNFYVRGTNLFTWVKDKNLAFDPEQGTNSASNLNVFIPKTVTVGLSVGF